MSGPNGRQAGDEKEGVPYQSGVTAEMVEAVRDAYFTLTDYQWEWEFNLCLITILERALQASRAYLDSTNGPSSQPLQYR